MPRSEIEMYCSMNLQNLRPRRDRGVINGFFFALACLVMLGLPQPAGAAASNVALFADQDLGDALMQAMQGAGPNAPRPEIKPSASAAACAAATGAAPRLALLAHAPTRTELDRCGGSASADVSVVEMGRQAVALVAPINSPAWSIDAASLFRALGQNGGGTPRPANWNAIDPSYPKLPIGLLVPPASTRTRHLFDVLIMQAGCERAATPRMPFEQKSRIGFCGALRTDIQVAERQGGAADVINWAATAPAGQIAVVSVAELRQLDRRVVPLLLDGALPTASNIESGRYPAAEKVQLMIVVPNAASAAQRAEARTLAFNLLAEASIGPTGTLCWPA